MGKDKTGPEADCWYCDPELRKQRHKEAKDKVSLREMKDDAEPR